MASSAFVRSRPVQRKSWMISYPDSGPEACSLLREKCPELEIDEFYSTSENGKWYSLLHLERKVRVTAVERGLDMLTGCGVNDVRVIGYDGGGDDREWFSILERHLADEDVRVAVWVKPGKTRSVVAGGIARSDGSRSKRPRDDGSSMEADALRNLLAEKDAQFELALAERECTLKNALQARDEDARLMLLRREEEGDKWLDAKEDELAALKLKSEQCDNLILRMAAEISQLKTECALKADDVITKRKGDSTQREIELAMDLEAERSMVATLKARLVSSETGNMISLRQMQLHNEKMKERVLHLEGDIRLMQTEAILWEQDRERKGIELESTARELQAARSGVRELHAKLKEEEQKVEELRLRAVEIVRSDAECESAHRIGVLQNAALMVEKETEFKNKEWKRRTEALRDELHAVRLELEAIKQ